MHIGKRWRKPSNYEGDALWSFGLYLQQSVTLRSVPLWSLSSTLRSTGDESYLHTCLGNQAVSLTVHPGTWTSHAATQGAEAICRRINDPAGLPACLGNQAVILRTPGTWPGHALSKEQEVICRQVQPTRLGCLLSLENQAMN